MLTDYLDNPIKRGDVVIYPTAAGSSAAKMNVAIVEAIDPIVTGLAQQRDGSFRKVTTLESYLMSRKNDPTIYTVPRKRTKSPGSPAEYVDDYSKAYILRVYKLDVTWNNTVSGRATILKNVDRVAVVPLDRAGPAFQEKIRIALDELEQMGISF